MEEKEVSMPTAWEDFIDRHKAIIHTMSLSMILEMFYREIEPEATKSAPPADDWGEFRGGCPAKEETGYGDGRNLVEICTLLKGRWPCIKENCVAYRAAKWNER